MRYAGSMRRGAIVEWATTYIERRLHVNWSSWDAFKQEFRGQFGEIDKQVAGRARLMRLMEGTKEATEY